MIAALVLGVGLATGSVLAANKAYEAEADLLVAPIPASDAILASVGLFVESNDPALDVETAARVIDSLEVAERAAEQLGGDWTAQEILDETTVEPIPESNVVTVIARSGDPSEATELANGFAEAAVRERTAESRRRIDAVLPRLQTQLETAQAGGTAAETLAEQVAELEVLRAGDNPTLRLEAAATVPESPVSPRPVLTIAGGSIAGVVIGLMIAFALQILDPVLRREEQLRSLFRLPILARVPRETKRGDQPLPPDRLTPVAKEAYRTLRATLAATHRDGREPRSIVVTGPGPSEGKTTTAINLAASLALAGRRVILIESDLRRPAIADALGVEVHRGVVGVLIEHVSLEDALVTSRPYGENLELLLADDSGPDVAELLSLPAAERMLDEASARADYVIIDAPPLIDVIDALPLAKRAEAVLLVAHIGRSHLGRLKELGELLAGNGIRPAGLALLGVSRAGRGYYYYAETSSRRRERASSLERTAVER